MTTDIVSSVRVQSNGTHVHIHVWNRGALCGFLVVGHADWHAIVQRLLPSLEIVPPASLNRDDEITYEVPHV